MTTDVDLSTATNAELFDELARRHTACVFAFLRPTKCAGDAQVVYGCWYRGGFIPCMGLVQAAASQFRSDACSGDPIEE